MSYNELGSPTGEAWNSLGTLYAVVAAPSYYTQQSPYYTLHLFRPPTTMLVPGA